MPLRALFPTHLYEASLAGERDFHAFNAELLDACHMLAEEDGAGRRWCRDHGYRGYTSYASLDDLPSRASVFGRLKRKLDRHASAFADALNLDLGAGRLRLDSLWVNVLRAGGVHSGHIHPHSVLSGTVYVATPPGAGALRLEDPRLSRMMARPPLGSNAPEDARQFVYVAPEAGTILMWESWLRHEVVANAARQERVSLSFNYAWA
jgi:uncharacterized protein (TIGR02466 family)